MSAVKLKKMLYCCFLHWLISVNLSVLPFLDLQSVYPSYSLQGRSSSLVGMWALEPSLLELLAGKLQPADQIQFLYHNHPALCLVNTRIKLHHVCIVLYVWFYYHRES